MTHQHLFAGVDGATPLGVLAAVGVQLACVQGGASLALLDWPRSHGTSPVLSTELDKTELLEILARDPSADAVAWITGRTYLKLEKNGPKRVGGGYPPVGVYQTWVDEALARNDDVALAYLAALFCATPGEPIDEKSVVHEKDMKKVGMAWNGPLTIACHACHFDFTSRNLQFLDQIRLIGEELTTARLEQELWRGEYARGSGRSMGWDPWSGTPGALASNVAGPRSPVQEWFAFRGLAQLTLVPSDRWPRMVACEGRRKKGKFVWPLWDGPLTKDGVRTLLGLTNSERWTAAEREARGVRAVYQAALTKTADGYGGTFSPAAPVKPFTRSPGGPSPRTAKESG